MTTPPDNPPTPPGATDSDSQGQGQPATPPPAPAPPGGAQGPPEGESPEELKAALAAARRDARKAQTDLDKLRREGMDDHQKAIDEARTEGRAEAMRAQGLKVAAAEFRALAAGRFADPAAAAAAVNLAQYVDEEGEVDSAELAKAVDALAAAVAPHSNGAPPPAAPRVPTGPRQSAEGRDDGWLRAAARRDTR